MNQSIYRICVRGLVLAAIAVGTSYAVNAQGYPNKPITIKVAFPAGGPADVSIRAANIVLQRNLGSSLITENVPGANGSISVMAVLRAGPRGGHGSTSTARRRGRDRRAAPAPRGSAAGRGCR